MKHQGDIRSVRMAILLLLIGGGNDCLASWGCDQLGIKITCGKQYVGRLEQTASNDSYDIAKGSGKNILANIEMFSSSRLNAAGDVESEGNLEFLRIATDQSVLKLSRGGGIIKKIRQGR